MPENTNIWHRDYIDCLFVCLCVINFHYVRTDFQNPLPDPTKVANRTAEAQVVGVEQAAVFSASRLDTGQISEDI